MCGEPRGVSQFRSLSTFWKGKTPIISNQVQYDEHEFPFQKRKIVQHNQSANATDI